MHEIPIAARRPSHSHVTLPLLFRLCRTIRMRQTMKHPSQPVGPWPWPFSPSPLPATRSGRIRPTTFRPTTPRPRSTSIPFRPSCTAPSSPEPNFRYHWQVHAYSWPPRFRGVIYQLPCNCRCDRALGHTSLHSCYETTHSHAVFHLRPGRLLRLLQDQGRLDARADSRRHCPPRVRIDRPGKAVKRQFVVLG